MNIEQVETEISSVDRSPTSTLVAAASSRGLSSSFIRRQKRRLLELREGLRQRIEEVTESLTPKDQSSQTHVADRSSHASECDFAVNLLSQEQILLYEIDQALQRIESKTYGICEISGKPIPCERLEAIPFARSTVEAQDQLEKERKARRLSGRRVYENEERERREEIGEVFG